MTTRFVARFLAAISIFLMGELKTAAQPAGEGATHYVNPGNSAPEAPYLSWATAATNIQDAIDAALPGHLVLVTNGTYAVPNQILVTTNIALRSLNGPEQVTIILDGLVPDYDAPNPLVWVDPGAVLDGFTVTDANYTGVLDDGGTIVNCHITYSGACGVLLLDGASLSNCLVFDNGWGEEGGGISAYDSTVSDCVVSNNFIWWYGAGGAGIYLDGAKAERCWVVGNGMYSLWAYNMGGGIYCKDGIVENCLVTDNIAGIASGLGGGIYLESGTVLNCTVAWNEAPFDGETLESEGGGIYVVEGTVMNSILYHNTAGVGANYSGGSLVYCCTTPAPGGVGNITNNPAFNGDFSLQLDSPCINAGTNQDWMLGAIDLCGNPRISRGIVDMGACERTNSPPVASNLGAGTRKDLPLAISTSKFLLWASDPDLNELLTIIPVSAVSSNGGNVVLTNGAVIYTPPGGFVGMDEFGFTISDLWGGTALASVMVGVSPEGPSLNLLPPIPIPGEGVQLTFAGIIGRTYSVQRALEVTGSWINIGVAQVDSTGFGSFVDTNPPPVSAFYRTVYP